MKIMIFFLLAFSASTQLFAQTQPDSFYRHHPVWIQMIEEENCNYNAAVKAFELFWLDKELPIGEHELFSSQAGEQGIVLQRKAALKGDARRFAFEYKKFKHWQEKVAPFVKPDGRIMNADERLQLWKQQYQNRK